MMKIFSALSVGMNEARNRAAARADERGIDMVWGIVIAIVALVVAVLVVPGLIRLGEDAQTEIGGIEACVDGTAANC